MTTALIGKDVSLTTKARVALVSRQSGSGIASIFARGGHDLHEFVDWAGFGGALTSTTFDLVLCDEEAAGEPIPQQPSPVMVLGDRACASHANIPTAAFETGFEAILGLAVQLSQSSTRCRELERTVSGIRGGSALIGRSPSMRRLMSAISRAADCDATVLVEGPSGAGKSLSSRMIHCKSRRVERALVAVEGATTTADALAKALEQARGSTIIVEDIDRLPATAQATLVRHLKERSPTQPGTGPRLIATTSAHLPELVARGAFREDLFYRLHALPIVVPSLRERTEDIAQLAQAVVESAASTSGKATILSPTAIILLESMSWPGNVAQLEATVRRAHLLAGGGTIDREHLLLAPMPTNTTANGSPTVRTDTAAQQEVSEDSVLPFEEEEQRMLTRALQATKGNVRRAAQLLGIGRATLYRKIQQYHLRLQ